MIYCVGLAELFRQLAKGMAATGHGRWVLMFGIAAMVYSALTVTPMHDLMVTITLGFFLAVDIVIAALALAATAVVAMDYRHGKSDPAAHHGRRLLPGSDDGGVAHFAETDVFVLGRLAIVVARAQHHGVGVLNSGVIPRRAENRVGHDY